MARVVRLGDGDEADLVGLSAGVGTVGAIAEQPELFEVALAARFGIDTRDRGFWESSMWIIEERIERYLALQA